MGLCVTNGAWVWLETDSVLVVGKTASLLGVCPDGNDAMALGRVGCDYSKNKKVYFGEQNGLWMR